MKTPRDAFVRLLEVLDQLEIRYLLGGSIASSMHGISRPTMDADIVVDLRPGDIGELVSSLGQEFYADADGIRDALRSGRAVNIIHYESTYKFDLFPLKGDAFSRAEFARRRYAETRSFGEPIEWAVATAEDSTLRKLLWYRSGGEISERQWSDARSIVRLHGEALDREYLLKWASELGVKDLLERLMD